MRALREVIRHGGWRDAGRLLASLALWCSIAGAAAPAPESTAPESQPDHGADAPCGSDRRGATQDSDPPASTPAWLARINFWRALAKLPAIAEDAGLSDANFKHARYVIENHVETIRSGGFIGAAGYSEDPNNRWHTEEGSRVAPGAVLAYGCGAIATEEKIDRAFASAFQRLVLLDPDLAVAGYGEYHKDGCWSASRRVPARIGPPQTFERPVMFPPDGARIALEWSPAEWPDPLSSCPGYTAPAGLPITIQFGRLIHPQISSHAIVEDGNPIEYCTIDASTYANPDEAAQEYGRWALNRLGAVAFIPRNPLRPGSVYEVSVASGEDQYAWSFFIERSGETDGPVR